MQKPAHTGNTLEPSTWVERYADVLYHFAMTRVYSKELAEDLVQETFLSAYDARHSFQGNSHEKTWLIAILKRKIIDHYRKKNTQKQWKAPEIDNYFHTEGELTGSWIQEKLPKNWTISLDEVLEKKEFYEVLHQCMSYLPEKWAACFSLKSLDEMPAEEVCKELNISSSNLWVILHRARLKLRECLEQWWTG